MLLLHLLCLTFATGCGRHGATGNAAAIRRALLDAARSDTTALSRDLAACLDTLPVRDEEDCERLYSIVNRATSEMHLGGDNPGAIRLLRVQLDILTDAARLSAADKSQMLSIYVSLGTAVKEQGMQDSGLDYYLTGLKLCTDTVLDTYRAKLFNNIGIAYGESGMLDKAESCFKNALAINLREKCNNEASLNYANLVELYMLRGDNDLALEASQHSLDRIDGDRPELLAFLRLQQGELYAAKGEPDIALQRYASALKQYQELGNVPGIVETYQHISKAYALSEKTDSAMFYADKALVMARSTSRDRDLMNTLRALSGIYEKEGNESRALALINESIMLEDSLRTAESRIRLNTRNLLEPQAVAMSEEPGRKAPAWIIVIIALILADLLYILFLGCRRRARPHADGGAPEPRSDYSLAMDKRNREMTTLSLERIRAHEHLLSVCDELKTILMELNPKESAKRNRIRALLDRLDAMSEADADSEFKFFFESVHPEFYRELHSRYPDLTVKDERLCAFLFLGLSTKEIAAITCREVRSVESARNRLRKKLSLDLSTDLTDHLRTLASPR